MHTLHSQQKAGQCPNIENKEVWGRFFAAVSAEEVV
jgi:hypothetical protein